MTQRPLGSNGHLNRYYFFVFVIHGLEINLSCFSKGWWSRALMKDIMGNVAEVLLTTKCKYVSHLARIDRADRKEMKTVMT